MIFIFVESENFRLAVDAIPGLFAISGTSGTKSSDCSDVITVKGTPFEGDKWWVFHGSIARNRCHNGLCVSCAIFAAGARHVR